MKFKHDLVELFDLKTVTANGKRFYVTPDGNRYPSVTTITGLLSKEAIQAWRKRVGEAEANKITRAAINRGNKVHKLAEMYLSNKPTTEEERTPLIEHMFEQLIEVLDDNVGTIKAIEAPLYSNSLKVGGRVDLVAEWDGTLSVIDFKTSAKLKKEQWIDGYFMQSAAYAVMFEERTQIPISQIVIAIAVEHNYPQVFIRQRDDFIEQFEKLRKTFDYEIINEKDITHIQRGLFDG
jgi:genome maintenance exonuclease 1